MTLLSAAVLLSPVLSGGLLVHLLWPERDIQALLFKAFLGIGIGLGLSSLLYFLYMLFFAGAGWFVFVQTGILLALLVINVGRERKHWRPALPRWSLTRVQMIFLGIAGLVFLVSVLSTASYLLRRVQGDWDAWMMYNRAARFIYRDQTGWLGSFSSRMDPIFHADYPLLLAMNIAAGWEALGDETPHVPMLISALFSLGCMGILVSALASLKSAGQAALGLIVFWGTPAVVDEGARQLADVPLASYMLATVILIYFYAVRRKPMLIVLAGLTAGLAAWTKNEGTLFVIAALPALILAFRRDRLLTVLMGYGLGLAFPLAIVLYFKLFMAPPSDVLSNGAARSIPQIMDGSRHLEILRSLGLEFLTFGGWTVRSLAIGVIPVLWVYYALLPSPLDPGTVDARLAGITMLALQTLGYYGIYLISPYPIEWHLNFSVERVVLQLFPVITFLVLCASRTPESIFGANSAN